MSHIFKSLCLSLAVAATASAAPAQTAAPGPVASHSRPAPNGSAAATLPNAFDGPAARPAAPAPLPAVPGGQAVDVVKAEGALRTVIGQLRTGELDKALFTPDLGGRMQAQVATIKPLLAGYGTLETVEPQGSRDGAGLFLVTFEKAATQWVLGLNEAGLISALLFRPAPAASSEPSAPPAG